MSVLLSGVTIVGRMSMSATASAEPTFETDPSGVTVNEGQSVIYTITTTNVSNGTTLYWTASGTVVAADFTDSAMSGSFTITDNEGTITRTLTEDAFTEGPENLYMDIRTESISGTIVASSALVVVGDTSLTPTDTLFNYNTLLLETSGVDAATNNTVLDSSSNNLTVTRTGTPTQGTHAPFSQTGWSGYFENGKYLTLPLAANSSIGALAGKTTTIECWMYCNAIIAITAYNMAVFGNYAGVAVNGRFAIYLLGESTTSAQQLSFVYTTSTGTEATITNTTGIQQNSWNHIALTIDATTAATSSVTLYVNGVGQTFSANLSTHTADPGIAFLIADTTNGLQNFNGNLSNFRITRSIVYASNFTPPTAPLTAIANTSLLTLQSSRFEDNSTNNFTITGTGSPRIQASSPFNPAAPYSYSTNGASLYFNGSSYVTIADTEVIRPGTGNFTYEFWLYVLSGTPNIQEFIYKGDGLQIYKVGGSIYASLSNNNTTTYFASGIIGSLVFQQWNHIALVRNGNLYSGYVNGVKIDLGTFADSPDTGTSSLNVGSTGIPGLYYYSTAYISNFRFVKGTAVYTSAFTPPTAPVTAITNTQLLLNGNNAGITDATSKISIDTAGNAQVSTSQSKFGGSSLYLDGTGDYITTRVPSSEYTFGRGNFTIETWIYATSVTGTRTIYDGRVAAGTLAPQLYMSSGVLIAARAGTTSITGTTTLSTNTWYHVALVRSSGVTKLYLNGVQEGSSYTDANSYVGATDRPVIGATGNGLNADYFQGYIDEFRVTKGVARYTSTFTPPVTAFLRY